MKHGQLQELLQDANELIYPRSYTTILQIAAELLAFMLKFRGSIGK